VREGAGCGYSVYTSILSAELSGASTNVYVELAAGGPPPGPLRPGESATSICQRPMKAARLPRTEVSEAWAPAETMVNAASANVRPKIALRNMVTMNPLLVRFRSLCKFAGLARREMRSSHFVRMSLAYMHSMGAVVREWTLHTQVEWSGARIYGSGS
jgi:hypothetical protein